KPTHSILEECTRIVKDSLGVLAENTVPLIKNIVQLFGDSVTTITAHEDAHNQFLQSYPTINAEKKYFRIDAEITQTRLDIADRSELSKLTLTGQNAMKDQTASVVLLLKKRK